jgi:HTH-type transcriptional regulator/antitoxin PezA
MKERMKKLRKTLDLTQQEFADRIGIKRNSYANYETGRNTPIDAIIVSICREFNVNEEWLRNGTGEMFLQSNRNADIARLTKELLSEESDSFKNRFISMLANLSVTEWEFLEQKAKELAGVNDEFND